MRKGRSKTRKWGAVKGMPLTPKQTKENKKICVGMAWKHETVREIATQRCNQSATQERLFKVAHDQQKRKHREIHSEASA